MNKKILLLVALVLIIGLGVATTFSKNDGLSVSDKSIEIINNDYKSKVVEHTTVSGRFSVEVPSDYGFAKDTLSLELIKNKDNVLLVTWIASEFDGLEEHLDNLAVLNKLRIEYDSEVVDEGNIESVYATIYNQGETDLSSRTYFVYKEGWVYGITARDEVLFGDLRVIAESFKILSD